MTELNLLKKDLYSNFSSVPGYVQLKQYMGQDIITPVNAARASFGVEIEDLKQRDKKLFSYCVREGHTSILEHNVLTFSIKVPLFVARQHMRHRTWAYNEISRRYTDKDLDFYLPNKFRLQSESNRQASVIGTETDPHISEIAGTNMIWPLRASDALRRHTEQSIRTYNGMIEAGVCKEQARMVLPQNLYTYYWATVNLNNFFKFCDLRIHEGAQVEIQEMAQACKDLAAEVWPLTFELYNKAKTDKIKNTAQAYLSNLTQEELTDLLQQYTTNN